MKKAIVTLYTYAELSEAAKAKALTSLADLNTSGEWWADIYKDAAAVGIEIEYFGFLERDNILLMPKGSMVETAKLILDTHSEGCETYKHAKAFFTYIDSIKNESWSKYVKAEALEESEQAFITSIASDYWEMLLNDHANRTSKAAIEESAHEYHFTTDGQVFSTPYDEKAAVISYIDYTELKKQKAWLQSLPECDEEDGLLNLIDAIQDYAVDVLGKDENEVFILSDWE